MVPLVLVLGGVILLVLMLRDAYSGRDWGPRRRTRATTGADGGYAPWTFSDGGGSGGDCSAGDGGGSCGGDGGGGGGGGD